MRTTVVYDFYVMCFLGRAKNVAPKSTECMPFNTTEAYNYVTGNFENLMTFLHVPSKICKY